MNARNNIQRALRRLKQAIERIEADSCGKYYLPLNPPIPEDDRDTIVGLIRLAMWKEHPEILKISNAPRLTPDKEGMDWFWCFGRKIGYAPDPEEDENFWVTNRRHEILKMLFLQGKSIEDLQMTFWWPSEKFIKKELARQGLIPAENPLK